MVLLYPYLVNIANIMKSLQFLTCLITTNAVANNPIYYT